MTTAEGGRVRTLVLGLGNPILGDDSVGLKVADAVCARLATTSGAGGDALGDALGDIEVDSDCWGGLHLMERLIGYDRAIIIDAVCSGRYPAGAVLHLGIDDVPTQHASSSHDVNLPAALQLAQLIGLKTPGDIQIIAIEAANVLDFGEECTPAVAAAIPVAVAAVLDTLGAGRVSLPDDGSATQRRVGKPDLQAGRIR
jgi:hydrogenase maturation protease